LTVLRVKADPLEEETGPQISLKVTVCIREKGGFMHGGTHYRGSLGDGQTARGREGFLGVKDGKKKFRKGHSRMRAGLPHRRGEEWAERGKKPLGDLAGEKVRYSPAEKGFPTRAKSVVARIGKKQASLMEKGRPLPRLIHWSTGEEKGPPPQKEKKVPAVSGGMGEKEHLWGKKNIWQ